MPESREAYVWIAPARLGGTPCIGGTRIPVEQVAEMILDGFKDKPTPWGELQLGYDLTRAQGLVACWYQVTFGKKRRFNLWREWAADAHGLLWGLKYDDVPDPPTRRR